MAYEKHTWTAPELITKEKLNDIEDGVEEALAAAAEVDDLKSEITEMTAEEMLLRDDLPGTSKTVTFDSDENPATITHGKNGTTVRTDVFTWGTNSVTEVRTLSSGEHITIVTNLTTLAQTISEVEVA